MTRPLLSETVPADHFIQGRFVDLDEGISRSQDMTARMTEDQPMVFSLSPPIPEFERKRLPHLLPLPNVDVPGSVENVAQSTGKVPGMMKPHTNAPFWKTSSQ